jgi:hypothetical protein
MFNKTSSKNKINIKKKMKRSYTIKPIIFFLLLFFFFRSFAQKEIDFSINLEEGMCFELQSTILSEGSVSINEKGQENKIEHRLVIQYHVAKKTPDFYHLNFMYTDYYSTMTIGMKEITTNPKTADRLNILDASTQIAMIMNKPFLIELSHSGKILTIKENKEIAKEFKSKTKKLSPSLREQVYTVVNSFAKGEGLVSHIENWTSYIPSSSVKIGDKWTIQKDSTRTTDYTFVAETDSTYIIKGVGNSNTTITNEIQGMVMNTNKEDEFTVSIEVDKQTFLPKIISMEIESLTKTEMPDYPAFSVPPSKSYTKSTLEIRNCH